MPKIHLFAIILLSFIPVLEIQQQVNNGQPKRTSLNAGTWFTNRLEDIEVLSFMTTLDTNDHKPWYYLGNIWYDKKQYKEAMEAWQNSIQLFDGFATVHRNMGIAYYNRMGNAAAAIAAFEKAFALDTTDARVLFELDYLYKRTNKKPADRLHLLKKHVNLVNSRDDLFIEFVTLHNLLGMNDEAAALLTGQKFSSLGRRRRKSIRTVYSYLCGTG